MSKRVGLVEKPNAVFISMSSFEFVKEGSIGILTFTREAQLNSLNKKVLSDLETLILSLEQEPHFKVLILIGAGKAFVAGADIKELQDVKSDEALELSRTGQRIFGLIEDARFVSIAAVNGFALGGGFELALACDICLGSESAKVGLPEVSLGLIPGYGGTQRLARQIGKSRAQYLIFSGVMLKAQKAFQYGLFSDIFPDQELLDEAKKLAKIIAGKSFSALRLAKKVIQKGLDHNLKEGLSFEAVAFSAAFESPDHTEGLKAFIEKRTPHFQGE